MLYTLKNRINNKIIMVYLLKVVGIPLDFIGKPFPDQRLKINIDKDVTINIMDIIDPSQQTSYVYT